MPTPATPMPVEEYLDQLPESSRQSITQLRIALLEHLPQGFQETISYGMLSYVVPHALYPSGYHCSPGQPLPFISIASRKNFITLHHMGLYANPALLNWLQDAYSRQYAAKLNLGKGCVRFKTAAQIPFELIGELAAKMTVQEWIAVYEKQTKK